MNRTATQGTVSKSLLDIIASSKDEEQLSESLIAALGGKTREEMTMTDEQLKLPVHGPISSVPLSTTHPSV